MPLASGTRTGPYEILAPLGAGGMGEVYRARDTRLQRDVAIKALPAEFASDAERLARFEREARLLASLNHPNVASIYGLEEAGGASYLVLEIVEGESLSEKLAGGPLPIEEALVICSQIAAGVSGAHEAGVIHRDLKPGNVMVRPDGSVKVLDFGLAKSTEARGPAGDISDSPTVTRATQDGVILGTAAYMSPEQARGRALDKRTDIWSFGCILYECLTGYQVFREETASDTMASILRGEPDWSRLPAETPARIRDLLRRCLQKDPKRRFHDIADARLDIEEALASPAEQPIPGTLAGAVRPRKGSSAFWIVLALAAGALLGAVVSRVLSPPSKRQTPAALRSSISLPAETHLRTAAARPSMALSPDGRKLVFRAIRVESARLYIRDLGQPDAVPIQGTQGGSDPFFSPDGEWLGFFAGQKIKKVALSGGPPAVLIDTSPVSVGGTWAPDGSIIFAPQINGGLARLPAGAKKAEVLTEPDASRGERGLGFPQLLPGGRDLLLVVRSGRDFDDIAASNIAVHSLDTGKRRVLVEGATYGRYAEPGILVFSKGTTLFAAPCDPRSWTLKGPAVAVLEDVLTATWDLSPFMAVSDGLLVWAAGGIVPLAPSRALWVDRTGKEEALPISRQNLKTPKLSPDGKRLAIVGTPPDSPRFTTFLYDFARGVLSPLATEPGRHFSPVWSPDGKRISLSSFDAGKPVLTWKAADSSGPLERLSTGEEAELPSSWSPDGRTLLFLSNSGYTDLWLLSADGKRERQAWLTGPSRKSAAFFSPDGKSVVYVSNESGKNEVYVTPFPGPGPRIKVSTDGGVEPAWAPSGREIFYRTTESFMAVPIQTQPELSAGIAKPVMPDRYEGYNGEDGGRNYDVSPDGNRFLVILHEEPKETPITHLNMMANWTAQLPAPDAPKR